MLYHLAVTVLMISLTALVASTGIGLLCFAVRVVYRASDGFRMVSSPLLVIQEIADDFRPPSVCTDCGPPHRAADHSRPAAGTDEGT